MSFHSNDPYNESGDYRRRSYQSSPGNQQRSTGLPATLPETASVNQELVPYDLGFRTQASIDTSGTYYPTGSNPGQYSTGPYQQAHGSIYPQPVQGTTPTPYAPGQSACGVYPSHGVNAQLSPSHHHPGADLHRSSSWSPQPGHIGHPGTPVYPHGHPHMIQTQGNNRGRREGMVPQRSYVPHHRQNYFDQFIPEDPITFFNRSGREGISLIDVMCGKFDYLIGRDDLMFPNYTGPAISLRLEWPGYKSWTKQIKTKNWKRNPGPITRSKLAIEVAKKVRSFIQDSTDEPITLGSERWRVGPGFIEAKDLVLVRLEHVSKGSWQAQFRAPAE